MFALIYFHSLLTMYVDFVQPTWEGYGFKLLPDGDRLIYAVLATLISTLFAPVKFTRVSDLLVLSMLIFTIIPTCVLFSYGGHSTELFATSMAVYFALASVRLFDIRFSQRVNVDVENIIRFLFAVSAISTVYLTWRIGLSSFSLDFINVYERREDVSSTLSLALDGYLSQILAQVNLLASIIALHYKRKLYFLLSMANALFIFGIFGHKAQIILPILLTFTAFILRYRNFVFLSMLLFTIISAFISYIYIYSEDPVALIALTYRRLMFVPVLLNEAYFTYAHAAGYVYWADSKFGLGIVEYRDTVSIANIIGEFVTGSIKAHANTGMIGSGYVQAGYIGVAVYTGILFAVSIVTDAMARAKRIDALATLICLPAFITTVMSSDLPAMLLSGGLGLAVIVLYLLPSEAP